MQHLASVILPGSRGRRNLWSPRSMENPRFAIFQFRAAAIIISPEPRCAQRRRNVYHKPDSTQTELPPLIFCLFPTVDGISNYLPTCFTYVIMPSIACHVSPSPPDFWELHSLAAFFRLSRFSILFRVGLRACRSKFIECLVSFCSLIRLVADFPEQDTGTLKLSLALFTSSAIPTSLL